jgi:hypothetical protein
MCGFVADSVAAKECEHADAKLETSVNKGCKDDYGKGVYHYFFVFSLPLS